MEAGYDYLLLRGHLKRRIARFTGIFLVVFGLLLLVSGGAYYGYAAKARTDLDGLNASLGDPQNRPAAVALAGAAISGVSLFPGEALQPSGWADPFSYEPAYFKEQALLEGFSPIEPGDTAPLSSLPPATRIIIPSIGVDSTISELAVLDLGDSRAYETPSNTVGHIPETANAGELGDSWFFGHTESPIRREGSVFFNLQKVPEKLRNGDTVYIITENGDGRFLYRATSSEVVYQDDLQITATGQPTIHLVSCVPRLVYDHRLVVSAELIAKG